MTIKVKIDGTAVPNIDTEYPLIGRAVVYAYIPDSDGSFATYSLGSGWGLDSGEAYYFLNIPPGAEEIVVYGALNYYGYESPVTVSLLELNYTGMELQRFRLLDLTGPPLRDGVDPAQNLQLVSIDGAFINSYLNNKSVFGADIRVLLSPGDKLTNAELQITGPTGTVATANLTAAGKSILARQSQQYVYLGSLGPQSEVNIFEMSPSEASKIKPATEKNHVKISLILRTEFGQELTVPYEDINDASLFPLLVYYQPKNRYGNNEDLQWGGDRWARPGVVERMTDISNTWNTANPSKKLTINDFSNMHGGPFPIHGAHKSGRSVDCRFDSFPLVIDGAGPYPGKAAAEDLAKFLNSLSDRDIERLVAIYVSWVKNSEFITTLKANLKDDKRRKLMTNVTGHKDHFHLEFRAKKVIHRSRNKNQLI